MISSLQRHWACQECGTSYDVECIEQRLVDICNRMIVRYQLQDLRCMKTNRASTKILSKQSDCSAELKLDIPRSETIFQLQILHNLAKHHDLEYLEEVAQGLLSL